MLDQLRIIGRTLKKHSFAILSSLILLSLLGIALITLRNDPALFSPAELTVVIENRKVVATLDIEEVAIREWTGLTQEKLQGLFSQDTVENLYRVTFHGTRLFHKNLPSCGLMQKGASRTGRIRIWVIYSCKRDLDTDLLWDLENLGQNRPKVPISVKVTHQGISRTYQVSPQQANYTLTLIKSPEFLNSFQKSIHSFIKLSSECFMGWIILLFFLFYLRGIPVSVLIFSSFSFWLSATSAIIYLSQSISTQITNPNIALNLLIPSFILFNLFYDYENPNKKSPRLRYATSGSILGFIFGAQGLKVISDASYGLMATFSAWEGFSIALICFIVSTFLFISGTILLKKYTEKKQYPSYAWILLSVLMGYLVFLFF